MASTSFGTTQNDVEHRAPDYCWCCSSYHSTHIDGQRCLQRTANSQHVTSQDRSKHTPADTVSVSSAHELSCVVDRQPTSADCETLSAFNDVESSTIAAVCGSDGSRTTYNQRPSVLRLTTFRPRTPSTGTTSTLDRDDMQLVDEHASLQQQQQQQQPAGSVDDRQQTVNAENVVDIKHPFQLRHHERIPQLHRLNDDTDRRLQPDLLPLVLVTSRRYSGNRLVTQLGAKSVDELL